jgi:hypothetical protein
MSGRGSSVQQRRRKLEAMSTSRRTRRRQQASVGVRDQPGEVRGACQASRVLCRSKVRRRVTALVQGLQRLGSVEGRNLEIDVRWGAGDVSIVGALQKASPTMPIVFVTRIDPVGGACRPGCLRAPTTRSIKSVTHVAAPAQGPLLAQSRRPSATQRDCPLSQVLQTGAAGRRQLACLQMAR